MQLPTSISKLKKSELRAIKFQLLEMLRDPNWITSSPVIISAKRLVDEARFAGQFDHNTKEIFINPDSRIDRSVEYYVHENLHKKFPDAPERSIDLLGRKIYADMTVHEREEVFKIMAASSKWDD